MRLHKLWIRNYWLFLFLSLVVFASIIKFILIPFEIIDYTLGMDLISESISIIITTIFLTWFFDLRENRRWKSVRYKVFKELGFQIQQLFVSIALMLELQKPNLDRPLYVKDPVDNGNRGSTPKLVEVQLNDMGREILLESDGSRFSAFYHSLLRRKDFLDGCEMKYFRFFDPDLRICIMDIQSALRHLVLRMDNQQFRKSIGEELSDKEYLFNMTRIMVNMLGEIRKLNKKGILLDL